MKKLPIPPNIYTFNSVRQYYRHFIQNNAFHLTDTTEIDIEKILRGTKVCKAAGIDDLSGRFLEDGSRVLSKPISELCNLSIKLGSFPDACKIAKLKPYSKKGPKTNPSNYRPISLLPLIFKVIEKLIHEQTSTFLSNNEILYKYQSGFRKNYLTDSFLTFLYDKILNGFDEGLMTGMILTNLQKASLFFFFFFFFFFFLSGFSFTDTDGSQDNRGREGTFFYFTLPVPPAHEYSDIYLQLCM